MPDGIVDVLSFLSFFEVLKTNALANPNTQLVSVERAAKGKINNLFLYITSEESTLTSIESISGKAPISRLLC
jgi:hypothetical protein